MLVRRNVAQWKSEKVAKGRIETGRGQLAALKTQALSIISG